ncbi:interferon regulatory factor 5-like isoform X2 [Pecten maximus]|uniref:interferon regulatory factor 5-like isoform X2 n=1 Tax=Pecten maximus TaxID=6579 RepID=UPI0014582BA2|nr:interferon regulatory factor 5-like isoform X2 [Pecten maximus]
METKSPPSSSQHREHLVVMETPSRQRLRPWLEAKINSKTIPGLYWLDNSQQIFRVPWKHGGKHDWHEEDSMIFKEWAIHTGRYREGVDTADWPTWKTRFRCALNKLPDIMEVKEKSSLDGAEPYRAYKFIPRRDSRQIRSPPVPIQQYTAPPELERPVEIPLRHDGHPSQFHTHVVVPTTVREDAPVSPAMGELVPVQTSTHFVSNHADPGPQQPEPPDYEMDLKMMYRHLDVYQSTCVNPTGCRLFYGQDPDLIDGLQQAMFGPDGLEHICFPPCAQILRNQKQVTLTNQLLNALDRGIILECESGSIYATRKCKCVVFVSSPSFNDGKPTKLQRDVKTLIFHYQEYFEPMLIRYLTGLSNKPSPEVLFGFGQNWRPNDQPLSNLLIAAVVGCSKARHKISQISFVSPESMPMEVSKSDDLDKYLNYAKIQQCVNDN